VLQSGDDAESGFDSTSTVLVFDRASGEPLFRIRSARLNYGDDLAGARWLADSSALVAQTLIDGRLGYSLVPADGSELTQLASPPRSGDERWYEQPSIRGAVPSPTDTSLVSFGRDAVLDRRSSAWQRAMLGDDGPAHLDPWGGSRDELVFALPHRAHELGRPLAKLERSRIEHPPFASFG